MYYIILKNFLYKKIKLYKTFYKGQTSGLTEKAVYHIMEITDIKIRKINAEGRMKAVVSVTFDDSFVVHDIKVIEGQEKLFIAMPSRKTPDGEFKDIAHPINADMRETLQNMILGKYEESLSEYSVEA